MNPATAAVWGVGVEIRKDGYCWMATVKHLGGCGTDYFRFNGRWVPVFQADIPTRVYRALRAKVRKAIRDALPKEAETNR